MDIGGYQTSRMLGHGSSGQVWQATAPDGAQVALKIFDGPYELAVERANREAAMSAQIDHPQLARVLAVVCDADRVALAVELGAAGSLADLLDRRGTLRPGEAVAALQPIAAALAIAHDREVVHGDLSPANIVFDGAGRPLLTDLGASRFALEGGLPTSVTPGYAAPEVARGGEASPAADVFALGAVALHCLTGRPAWNAVDLRDVVVQSTVGQWPDPQDAALPPVLVAVLRSALTHDPGKRPGAATFALDLARAVPAEPIDLAGAAAGQVGAWIPPAELPTGPADDAHADDAHADDAHDDDAHNDDDADLLIGFDAPSDGAPAFDEVGVGAGSGSIARQRILRAATRLRDDALPAISAPDDEQHGDRRARMLRLAAIAVAAVVVLIGAVGAGLFWASSDSAAGGRAPADGALASAVARSDAVSSPGTATAASTSGGHKAEQAVAPKIRPPRSSSSLTATSPAATATVAAKPDWLAVVRDLDLARAKAFADRDPAALTAVYTATSPARLADAATIGKLVATRTTVTGAAHRIVTCQRTGMGSEVIIEVTDSLPSYQVIDEAGSVVGRTKARPAARRLLHLVAVSGGYRIAAITQR